MSTDDDRARAAQKSRDWKARQAEFAAARAADEEHARAHRAAIAHERLEHARHARPSHMVLHLAVVAVIFLIALLLGERYLLQTDVDACFAPPSRALHQANCANRIAASKWWWLLPSDQQELIRAKQAGDR